MRRLFSVDGPLPPIFLPICAAIVAVAAIKGPAVAAELSAPVTKAYMVYIPQQDGYGLADCLLAKRACGKVVADSWCSANGHGRALAWGSTNDMTATISKAAIKPPANAIAVSCSE